MVAITDQAPLWLTLYTFKPRETNSCEYTLGILQAENLALTWLSPHVPDFEAKLLTSFLLVASYKAPNWI